MRKVISSVGLLGALTAAEGLNRMSALVHAFSGKDGPIYSVIVCVSLVAAGVLLVSLFSRVAGWVKMLTLVGVIGGATMLLAAPSVGAIQQAAVGLVGAAVGILAVSTKRIVSPGIASTGSNAQKGD